MPGLVLTRKRDESILIGEDIRVTVVRTGEEVRLMVQAPETVKILREELLEPEKERDVA